MESNGIDYDLSSCLKYNSVGYTDADILHVIAVYEGQNDGPAWRWVLEMKNGDFEALEGWCDYTGWDCQSGATSVTYKTARAAVNHFKNEVEVLDVLLKQLINNRKQETWVEKTSRELGVEKPIDTLPVFGKTTKLVSPRPKTWTAWLRAVMLLWDDMPVEEDSEPHMTILNRMFTTNYEPATAIYELKMCMETYYSIPQKVRAAFATLDYIYIPSIARETRRIDFSQNQPWPPLGFVMRLPVVLIRWNENEVYYLEAAGDNYQRLRLIDGVWLFEIIGYDV